jgi:hypothetical protein
VKKDEAGLDGATNAEVDWQVDDPGAVCPGGGRRRIGGSVVDDDDISARHLLLEVMNDTWQ